jgi:hypothetical protein
LFIGTYSCGDTLVSLLVFSVYGKYLSSHPLLLFNFTLPVTRPSDLLSLHPYLFIGLLFYYYL